MATFDQNITAIKQAQYGYEVRDAIAESLTQCYNKDIYSHLDYELFDVENGKMIDIPLPNGKTLRICTHVTVSKNSYAYIQFGDSVSCYYANCAPNPTYSIMKNFKDGSINVKLTSSLNYVSKTTNIRVGYDTVETSLLISSSSSYSGGSGNFAEIKLYKVSYSGGFSATETWYPGTIANPNYIPLVMTDFGGPGECLTSVSSVPTSFDGKNLYRDISTEGRTGSHFYTRFVYGPY